MARDTRKKRKVSKNIATGVAHVNSTFNNTKILISDVQGNAIAWSSAGSMGFKGSPYFQTSGFARRRRNTA